MDAFKAFAAAQSASLGDLTIESDEEQLAVYGNLTLKPDEASLGRLDRLIALLTQARAGLTEAMARGEAPDVPPEVLPSVLNPFA